jgi:hypothetical protein
MYFKAVALLSLSLLGASSGKEYDVVTDFEDVPTCGKKKKDYCNTGPFYEKMKNELIAAPVVEGFYVEPEETEKAQGAINSLIFYFQKKCKNCVEEEAKDELCALKDPIYQGIFDWVSDTMKDSVATYCPPEDFVCGKKHYELCNGDLYSKMSANLKSTPKNGGTAAPEALNELNGFFTHVCKSCVDHGNAKALCDSTKVIVSGIINNDDREYEDPTAKFCGELAGTPATPAKPAPKPAPAPAPKPAPKPVPKPAPAPAPKPAPCPAPAAYTANWWSCFDNKNWCTVSGYMTGMWRNDHGGWNRNDGIYRIEQASSSEPPCKLKGGASCYNANWWSSFDRKGWSLCNNGYYMNGMFRNSNSHGHGLHLIEEAKCCKPTKQKGGWGTCYDLNVWSSFDKKGWSKCAADHYMTGLWRNSCDNLYCIELFKCCKMGSSVDEETEP